MTNDSAIESLLHLCGCSGKPPIDSVARPAIKRVRECLDDSPVLLGNDPDVGLVPRTDNVQREFRSLRPGEHGGQVDVSGISDYTLAGTFVDTKTGNDVDQLSQYLFNIYSKIGNGNQVNILKGHSILIKDASAPIQIFEDIQLTGEAQPGITAANIDVIHSFPELVGEQQARIAICNAANDCYTVGAHEDMVIRPLVLFPQGITLSNSSIEEWYSNAAPEHATVLDARSLEHDGTGWLFGTTITAASSNKPPRFTSKLAPGDEVLINRPFGGLATFTASVESGDFSEDVVKTLTKDHINTAKLIESYCPGPDEDFDQDKHIKLVTDISGPGIRGVLDYLSSTDLLLTALPLIDDEKINSAQQRWLLPDVTVETNGPLLIIGSNEVIESISRDFQVNVESRFENIGYLTEGSGTIKAKSGLNIGQYIEFEGSESLS